MKTAKLDDTQARSIFGYYLITFVAKRIILFTSLFTLLITSICPKNAYFIGLSANSCCFTQIFFLNANFTLTNSKPFNLPKLDRIKELFIYIAFNVLVILVCLPVKSGLQIPISCTIIFDGCSLVLFPFTIVMCHHASNNTFLKLRIKHSVAIISSELSFLVVLWSLSLIYHDSLICCSCLVLVINLTRTIILSHIENDKKSLIDVNINSLSKSDVIKLGCYIINNFYLINAGVVCLSRNYPLPLFDGNSFRRIKAIDPEEEWKRYSDNKLKDNQLSWNVLCSLQQKRIEFMSSVYISENNSQSVLKSLCFLKASSSLKKFCLSNTRLVFKVMSASDMSTLCNTVLLFMDDLTVKLCLTSSAQTTGSFGKLLVLQRISKVIGGYQFYIAISSLLGNFYRKIAFAPFPVKSLLIAYATPINTSFKRNVQALNNLKLKDYFICELLKRCLTDASNIITKTLAFTENKNK